MTLLASVNAVLRDLRQQEAASISDGLEHQTVVGYLNAAADEVLNAHQWSFLRRYDGQAFLPAPVQVDDGGTVSFGFSFGTLNSGSNAWAVQNVFDFTGQAGETARVRARIIWTGETQTYGVTELSVAANFPYTQQNPYRGAGHVLEGWTIYAHEWVLPATVRQVIQVWHEDREMVLEAVDRDYEALAAFPRSDVVFADPVYVSVGGITTATTNDSGLLDGTATGMTLTVWPAPQSETVLRYSYLFRFPELSEDADEWTGVPSEHIRLIERKAYEKCCDGGMEDDPAKAARLAIKNEAQFLRLKEADGGVAQKRFRTPEIGAAPTAGPVNRRWASQTIPTP